MRRNGSVLLTIATAVLLAILFFGLIVPPFIDQFLQLVELLPPGVTQVLTWFEEVLERKPDWVPTLQLPTPANLTSELQPILRGAIQNFFAFFSNSLSVLLDILIVSVLALMILANPIAYRNALIQLFPSFYRRRVDDILLKCEVSLGNWLGGILISSTIVAFLSAVGLSILGVPLVLAHALLAGLLNFIPNIGPTLSLIFPLIVALMDAPWKGLAVIILYLVIQNVESYVLTPTVMARQVSLLPALTLAAQIFFATFFGFLGLLLALPLTVVAKVWIQEALVEDILDRWGGKQISTADPPGDRKIAEQEVTETAPSLVKDSLGEGNPVKD